jgi:hypothetical protein
MLEAQQEQREQDRWLALARTGLAMMTSRNPRLAGAIGEAGLAGLEGLQGQNRQFTQDRFEMLRALENARLQRAQLAARAAGGGRQLMLTPNQQLAHYTARMSALEDRLSGPTLLTPDQRTQYADELTALQRTVAGLMAAYGGIAVPYGGGPTVVPAGPPSP